MSYFFLLIKLCSLERLLSEEEHSSLVSALAIGCYNRFFIDNNLQHTHQVIVTIIKHVTDFIAIEGDAR
ncbi:hypothetical protein C9J21_17270 [Photobacterium phosphoreum]|uniref:Uncharacterized protein n=1 Tax=Photobacterium phosphoreum TaxID=659 RepID=A0ABX5G996_PHOPO|nr:hypothetical protein CTM96_00425 [Photobacterium phosphoreum]PSU41534.1 hypothetical protein CTM97_13200 [Photobacterium phosphoreum]PSU78926.1 hypothetical protein CTM67_12220 [Photobacterium phosphoreum]PSW31292.1 hypothetical protein C9J21_17270 [Photobacterium phosphoreum]